MTSMRRRRTMAGRAAVVVVLGVGLALLPAPPAALAWDDVTLHPGTNHSLAGPLEHVWVSDQLSVRVLHRATDDPDGTHTWPTYKTTALLNGQLYSQHAQFNWLGVYAEPFTPISQTGPHGTGTAADPFRIVTTVELGTTGVRLVQTDTYRLGSRVITSGMRVINTNVFPIDGLRIYRFGECMVHSGGIASESLTRTDRSLVCNNEGNAHLYETWTPLSEGSAALGGPSIVISGQPCCTELTDYFIAHKQPFPGGYSSDPGNISLGFSWDMSLAGEQERIVAMSVAFSAGVPQVDTDGDGLLDEWETQGIDADFDGIAEVDLPAMGADPRRKDIFVEVDWMSGKVDCVGDLCFEGSTFEPQEDALLDVIFAFANAPVPNPDGSSGITMHIDAGPTSLMNPRTGQTWGALSEAEEIPHTASLGTNTGGGYDWTAFQAVRDVWFETVREDVFHYAIFADTYAGANSSGLARGIPGADFLVTDGPWKDDGGFTLRQEAGTFMHELGHTLGLRHGGSDDVHFKPNYRSIMNYHYQLGNDRLDYSRGAFAPLNETDLNENVGLDPDDLAAGFPMRFHCPDGQVATVPNPVHWTDWNCDGTGDEGIAQDINGDGQHTTLTGYDDWPNLVYDGGAIGDMGASDLDDAQPPPRVTPDVHADEEDLASGDGDGAVAVVGPAFAFPGVEGQKVLVDVTNVGATAASYRVAVSSSLPGFASTTVEVTDLAGGATRRVEVDLDGTGLAPGDHTVTAEVLTPDDTLLSEGTRPVTVPDLSDPAVLADLADALAALRSGVPDGLDSQLVGLLRDALEQLDLPGGTTRTPTESFVTAALTDFLGTADPALVAAGVAAIDGGRSRSAYLATLTTSDEWLEAVVQDLYQDTLGRPGEAGGVAFWTGRIRDGGWSVARVSASFYASPEYYGGIGGGTDATWITDLYVKILERSPDAGGLDYWVGQVAAQGRGRVALRFFQSPESARTRVTNLYQALLGRNPVAADVTYWSAVVVARGDLVLAVGLAASPEYLSRARTRFP